MNFGLIKLREKILNDLRNELKNKDLKFLKFLDLGTGEGENIDKIINPLAISLNFNYEVLCVDIIPDSFKHHNEENIKFLKYDLEEDFYFGDFDIILATEVIEHLQNPYKFIKNCLKNLKNDGIIYISSPNVDNIYSLLKILFKNIPTTFEKNELDHIMPVHHFLVEKAVKKAEIEENFKINLNILYDLNIFKIILPFRVGRSFVKTIFVPFFVNRFFSYHVIYKIKKLE